MVILQVNKFFFEKGGSERYFFALSRSLSQRGHRVAHFSMQHPRNQPSPFARHFVPQRDYEGPLRSWSAVRSAGAFVRSRDAADRVAALVDETGPDVAHLHNVYHQLTPSIIDALRARRVPMVMTLHDYKLICPSYALFAHDEFCYRCRGGRFVQALVHRCGGGRARSALLAAESYWQRWTRVYERVDCFVAPSEYLRTMMVQAGVAPARIVHVPPFAPDDGDGGGRGQVPELPPRFIAYVGRLSPEKGVGVLLEAMECLPQVPLVVFGDGPEADRLRDAARAKRLAQVQFTGHVSRAVLRHAWGRAVVLVQPSLSPENAPMAVLEAASAGVPVIVSNMGGLPELAERIGARVVAARDVRALAGAVADVWSDAEGCRARAAAAWESARAHFDRDRHVDAIEGVYRAVMAPPAAAEPA